MPVPSVSVGDDAVVDDRLVDGDRDDLVRAEEHRVRELRLVVDAGDVEHADADRVRREPDADAAARKLADTEELVEAGREGGHVHDLAAGDDAGGQRLPLDLEQLRAAVAVDDARGRDLRRAELDADELGVRGLGAETRALLALAGLCRRRLAPALVSRISFFRFMRHLPGV